MMDFACSNISIQEVIRCSFALNKTEYNLLLFLINTEFEGTAIQIAKKMNLERTTIQKAITKLLKKKIGYNYEATSKVEKKNSRGCYGLYD